MVRRHSIDRALSSQAAASSPASATGTLPVAVLPWLFTAAGRRHLEVGQSVVLQPDAAGDERRLHSSHRGELALRHELAHRPLDLPFAVAFEAVLTDDHLVDLDASTRLHRVDVDAGDDRRSHEGVFTERLIGKVAIHAAVPRNTRHPTMSNAVRVPVTLQLGAHAREE